MTAVSTLKKGGTVGGTVGNNYPINIVHWEIDIAKAVAAGLATTDYVVVQSIPANTYFQLLQVQNVDAPSLGAGARFDLGDSASATVFVNNSTTMTAGFNHTLASSAGSDGIVYKTANELRLKVTGATLATGTVRFVYAIADTSRNQRMTVQS